jgi:hypothetical protein
MAILRLTRGDTKELTGLPKAPPEFHSARVVFIEYHEALEGIAKVDRFRHHLSVLAVTAISQEP